MPNRIDNSTYLPTIFKQLFSPIMEGLKSFKDISITDKSLKKCYRCKKMKDREEEFHHGASMCKDCRKEYDMERNSGGNKELIMTMRKAILELGEQVEKLTKRVDELERNNVEEQKVAKKISVMEPVENGPAEDSSEEDEPAEESSEDDEPEPEKKPKKKVKSSNSDEAQKAKKEGKKTKKEESSEKKKKKEVKSAEKTTKKNNNK